MKKKQRRRGKTRKQQKKIKALEDQIAELKKPIEESKQQAEAKKQADAAWQKQLDEFTETYPDIDLAELEKNEKFIDFIEGSGWTLKKGYEKFVKFYGDAALETIVKVKSKEERSTSGGKGSKNTDGQSYGLTEAQKKEVDDWNKRYPKMPMTYKQYANR